MVPSATSWSTPPEDLELHHEEVHIWRASFYQLTPYLSQFEALLSSDERSRAQRYKFEENRSEYTLARGLLRNLLGLYQNADPLRLRFVYNPYGKPSLVGGAGQLGVSFNVSHSHGIVLYAFSRNRELGIDLERIRPEAAQGGVAERFFSQREVSTLRSLPEYAQPLGFFNCWTRKEAYIKARGEGLSIPLNQFDVSLAPGEPAALLESRVDPTDINRWSLHALNMGTQYVAALAVEGQECALKCWDWRPRRVTKVE